MKRSCRLRVKARLMALGKTQRQLARALNYSEQYLSNVLNGLENPAMLSRIERILRVWEQQKKEAGSDPSDGSIR
jgi:transcriptional regulator with XRE-family HTH domain